MLDFISWFYLQKMWEIFKNEKKWLLQPFAANGNKNEKFAANAINQRIMVRYAKKFVWGAIECDKFVPGDSSVKKWFSKKSKIMLPFQNVRSKCAAENRF